MSKYIERPLLAKFAEKTKKTASGRPAGKFCRETRVLQPHRVKKRAPATAAVRQKSHEADVLTITRRERP